MKYSNLKNVLAALSVTSSLVIATPALAADSGFYIGGSVGITNLDVDGSDLQLTNSSIDDNDTGYKIFAGYDFSKNWGIELSYADLGEYEYSGIDTGVNVRGNVDVTAYALAVVGTYPINNDFAVFGKLGAYSGDVEINETFGTTPSSFSDNDSNALFGLGLKYNITKQFSVRGEWDRYHDSDNPLDLFSIGVAYKF